MVGSFRTGQENPKTQKGEEGVGWSILSRSLGYVITLNEMDLFHLKGKSNKSKVKVSKGEVKVIKLTSQGHMAAPNWSLQKAWHTSLGDTWHTLTRHAYRDPRNVYREILPRVPLYF